MASNMMTECPNLARKKAQVSPAGPPPTTAMRLPVGGATGTGNLLPEFIRLLDKLLRPAHGRICPGCDSRLCSFHRVLIADIGLGCDMLGHHRKLFRRELRDAVSYVVTPI